MPRKTMIEAIRDAMDVMMGRDENVVVFGEDVGFFGGVFRCTQGLQAKYGKSRCFDAPISEFGIVGAAIGMAAYGLRPCVEVQFADYVYPAYDQIVSEAARLRYRSNGDFTCPIVVRMPTGGGIFGGQTHSQSPEALFTHVSGLKTVVPSNPHDAKGLLIAAIEDPDPVIFLEPKRLYNGPFDGHHDRPVTPWSKHELGEVADGHYSIPLGKAVIRRPGAAVTVLAYGTMVYVAEAAAEETGIDAEIIDLRTLLPLDLDTIVASVKKTGRCVVVHEATLTSGFGAELSALVQEHCFYHLEAPVGARHRLGHALSARPGMGLFPRAGPGRPRAGRNDGGVTMGEHVIKLPDVGEGVAEAELVEWHVKVGDLVREDALLAAVMTDKATVEIPSPVDGEVLWLGAEIGDTVAVGSPIVRLKVAGEGNARGGAAAEAGRQPKRRPKRRPRRPKPRRAAEAPAAKPRRARAEAGEPAAPREGAGTSGRRLPARRAPKARSRWPRRRSACAPGRPASICARSPAAARPAASPMRTSTPSWRAGRSRARRGGPGAEHRGRGHQDRRAAPQDRREDGAGEVAHPAHHLCRGGRRHRARGIARRAQQGEARRPAEADAAAVPDAGDGQGDRRAARPERAVRRRGRHRPPPWRRPYRHRRADAGRAGRAGGASTPRRATSGTARPRSTGWPRRPRPARATRDELSGSTITITSLGAMGGVATTPVINHPEVAIVGVNKMMVRPVWDGSQFIPRKMMNLSSSFDHRVVDGWDAAVFIQRIKALLETPALIFVEG